MNSIYEEYHIRQEWWMAEGTKNFSGIFGNQNFSQNYDKRHAKEYNRHWQWPDNCLAAFFLLGNHLKYIVQQIQLRVENRYKTKRSADYNRIEDNRRGNMLTQEPKSELGSPRGELRRTGNNWVDDKGKASRVLLVRGSREKFIDFIGGDVVSG